MKPAWPGGLRPPWPEFLILCLEGSVTSFTSPSSGGSHGPVVSMCSQRWPKTPFILFSFLTRSVYHTRHVVQISRIYLIRVVHVNSRREDDCGGHIRSDFSTGTKDNGGNYLDKLTATAQWAGCDCRSMTASRARSDPRDWIMMKSVPLRWTNRDLWNGRWRPSTDLKVGPAPQALPSGQCWAAILFFRWMTSPRHACVRRWPSFQFSAGQSSCFLYSWRHQIKSNQSNQIYHHKIFVQDSGYRPTYTLFEVHCSYTLMYPYR